MKWLIFECNHRRVAFVPFERKIQRTERQCIEYPMNSIDEKNLVGECKAYGVVGQHGLYYTVTVYDYRKDPPLKDESLQREADAKPGPGELEQQTNRRTDKVDLNPASYILPILVLFAFGLSILLILQSITKLTKQGRIEAAKRALTQHLHHFEPKKTVLQVPRENTPGAYVFPYYHGGGLPIPLDDESSRR
jgi:hypothetical protein